MGQYTSRHKSFDGCWSHSPSGVSAQPPTTTSTSTCRRSPSTSTTPNSSAPTTNDPAMTMSTTTIEHRHADSSSHAALRRGCEHYETLVPELDFARFFQMASWQATLELAEIHAPHGFSGITDDVTATMAGSACLTTVPDGPHHRRTDVPPRSSVALHATAAPAVRRRRRDTKLAVDQPSLLFASHGNPTSPTRTRRAARRPDHVARR